MSSTGEMEYCFNRSLKVVTPTAESLVLHENVPTLAGKFLKVEGNHVASNAFVGALDGKPLPESKRMLFLFLTDQKNSGCEITNGHIVSDFGRLPLIIRKATIQATLAMPSEPEIWALDYTGARKVKVPVKKVADGYQATFTSVTDKDTYYAFEVIR